MSDVASKLHAMADQIAAEGMVLRAANVRAGAFEIECLRAQLDDGPAVTDMLHELRAEIEQLKEKLNEAEKDATDNLAQIARLRVGIDQIVGMCLSDVGIGKIHAAACALLGKEGVDATA